MVVGKEKRLGDIDLEVQCRNNFLNSIFSFKKLPSPNSTSPQKLVKLTQKVTGGPHASKFFFRYEVPGSFSSFPKACLIQEAGVFG